MTAHEIEEHFFTVPKSTQEQRRAAQLAVCARATDVDDARILLETLDLMAPA